MRRTLQIALSMAALAGVLALLLADSAGPECIETSFKRNFVVEVSACGNYLERVSASTTSGGHERSAGVNLTHLDGDVLVESIIFSTTCNSDDEPLRLESADLVVQVAIPDAASARLRCTYVFSSGSSSCSLEGSSAETTCVVKIGEFQ